jgi:hypothetical protein
MNLSASLDKIQSTLDALAKCQESGVFDTQAADLIKDAQLTIHDAQTALAEEAPSDYLQLNNNELAIFRLVRGYLGLSDIVGLIDVLHTAYVRLLRMNKMGALFYQQPEFKESIESQVRIKAQFIAWLELDERMSGCRGLSTLEVAQMEESWEAAAIKYRSLPRIFTDAELIGLAKKHGLLANNSDTPDIVSREVIQLFAEDLIKLVHT